MLAEGASARIRKLVAGRPVSRMHPTGYSSLKTVPPVWNRLRSRTKGAGRQKTLASDCGGRIVFS